MKFQRNSIYCDYCGRALAGHPRCKKCEILLHAGNSDYFCKKCGEQHSLERQGWCVQCFHKLKIGGLKTI